MMLLSGRRGDVIAVSNTSYDEMNATLTSRNSSLRLATGILRLASAHTVRNIMCVPNLYVNLTLMMNLTATSVATTF